MYRERRNIFQCSHWEAIIGKRSNFDRIEKDYYRTIDKRAVAALLPFLDEETRFIEPFAGVGDLVEELEAHGHKCVYACDNSIYLDKPEYIDNDDAFNIGYDDILRTEIVISNPPWSRPILHKAIEHFANITETWFLFDANWAQTKQSSELMRKYCTDIVAVGRLIWIPGTTMSGKDDCAWYRFSADKYETTRFHGR